MNIQRTNKPKIGVVGAGIGGLSAAIALASAGCRVTIFDKEAAPGGKMRAAMVDGSPIDSGPTVLTMKWVFDGLLKSAGTRLDDLVSLNKAEILARHYWPDGSQFDLSADIDASAQAIERFSDRANAEGYRRFCRESKEAFDLLRDPFIADQKPGMFDLPVRIGLSRVGQMLALRPFTSMWRQLESYFTDPRLVQLFGRYATYVGSSPFKTPATLMLVAHVEQAGVWIVPEGMHGLAAALRRQAEALGVAVHLGEAVESINIGWGGVNGLRSTKADYAFDAILYNGDVSALGSLVPDEPALNGHRVPASARSLSAHTWCVKATVEPGKLAHHTVFFSDDYVREFNELAKGLTPWEDPTVYICAPDLDDSGRARADITNGQRLFLLVNAPADSGQGGGRNPGLDQGLDRLEAKLSQLGTPLRIQRESAVYCGPEEFSHRFPGSGGALYGRASHGWLATFRRAGARCATKGLYLAGGSVHPGPGVPMAAMSGRLAAACIVEDFASTMPSSQVDIAGGMPTA